MRDKVLIFGGTTEGRELAAALSAAGVQHLVSVATDYGKEIEDSFGEKNVIVGRKNSDEMAELMVSGGFTVCVDATHPFATLVSAEIKKACEKTGVEYIRLLRDTGAKAYLEIASSECGAEKRFDEKVVRAAGVEINGLNRLPLCDAGSEGFHADMENGGIKILSCDSVVSAAKELEKIQGNILLLTGSKDLKAIMTEISDKSRVYARVLPNIESITKCEEAGLRGKQIIAMQGPFSKDMNVALIKDIGAAVILTKESGATGGLDEKLLAARECGIKAIMIKSPESRVGGPGSDEGAFAKGYSLAEVLEKLGVDEQRIESIKVENDEISSIGVNESGENEKKCRVSKGGKTNIGRNITLAGIGPGDARYYTRELEVALESADVIFGAKSILDRVDKSRIRAEFVPLYMGKDILEYLEKSGFDEAVVVHEESGESKASDVGDVSGDGNKNVIFDKSAFKYKNPLALFSGDISLCSGAKNAVQVFEGAGYKVRKISGISSAALFANRLGLGLEDCSIVSAHGRECNVAGYIAETKKLIILPSSCAHAGEIARLAFDVADSICDRNYENKTAEQIGLKYASEVNAEGLNDDADNEVSAGCGNLKIVIGYELGTVSEKILEITRDDLCASGEEMFGDSASEKKMCEYGIVSCGNSIFSPDEKGKCLLYIENKRVGETPVIRGISDDEFIRGKTPMTKEEIRAISIRKLGLSADSVLYDIGAGTGSVSVEAALLHPDIKVCAIEQNDEAVELIKKNKEKFCADNITVIKGEASEVLGKMAVSEIAAPKETGESGIFASASECSDIGVEGKLLVPTHAFIGGSGGNMRAIIDLLKQRNPNVRIVINCVTLETLTEVLTVIKEGDFAEPDIVQVSASRYRKVGEYHMADAINPVYIVTVSGI